MAEEKGAYFAPLLYVVVLLLASSHAMAEEKGAYFEMDTVRLPQKELRMTLYVHQIISGPKKNQEVVVLPRDKSDFGTIAANDWADGMGRGANLVGNVQGMHIGGRRTAGTTNWNIYFDLVFKDGRFNGSTLKLLGSYGIAGGEWAIVGGTGEFTLAQGVAAFQKVRDGGSMCIRELKFHVFYTPLKSDAIQADPSDFPYFSS